MIIVTRKLKVLSTIISIFTIILLLPYSISIPVKGASSKDWNKDTFWFEPWGISGVHKGVDIFSRKSTEVLSPTFGLVLYEGEIAVGGKVIITIGPNWRLHYFAHLNDINTHIGSLLSKGEAIGTVGDTGNAKGKQPHLHYSLISLVPYLWEIDTSNQGWKKMFYLNPLEYFNE